MTFNEHKIQLINKLQSSTDFKKDDALQRIVDILNDVNSIKDLKKKKGLINRISVDSVLSWDSINLILEFTDNYIK